MTLEQWNKVLSINLCGQFLCARAAVREFRRRGIVHQISCAAGKIISMSSVHQASPQSVRPAAALSQPALGQQC